MFGNVNSLQQRQSQPVSLLYLREYVSFLEEQVLLGTLEALLGTLQALLGTLKALEMGTTDTARDITGTTTDTSHW